MSIKTIEALQTALNLKMVYKENRKDAAIELIEGINDNTFIIEWISFFIDNRLKAIECLYSNGMLDITKEEYSTIKHVLSD